MIYNIGENMESKFCLDPINNSYRTDTLITDIYKDLRIMHLSNILFHLRRLHYRMLMKKGKYQLEIINELNKLKNSVTFSDYKNLIKDYKGHLSRYIIRTKILTVVTEVGLNEIKKINRPKLTDDLKSEFEVNLSTSKNYILEYKEQIQYSKYIGIKIDQIINLPNQPTE